MNGLRPETKCPGKLNARSSTGTWHLISLDRGDIPDTDKYRETHNRYISTSNVHYQFDIRGVMSVAKSLSDVVLEGPVVAGSSPFH